MFTSQEITLLEAIHGCSRRARVDVYVVGGIIRDLYLRNAEVDKDFDFIVVGNAISFAEICQEVTGGELKRFPDFVTAKICNPTAFSDVQEIDTASARREVYPKPGRLPEVSLSSIQEDLKRRDFSINAMAVAVGDLADWAATTPDDLERLRALTIDLFGGANDLSLRVVRVLHDASFIDDPTRLFRAARYAGRLGAQIETHTAELFKAAVQGGALDTISRDRKFNELRKISCERNVPAILEILQDFNLFEAFPLYDKSNALQVLRYASAIAQLHLSHDLSYELLLRVMFHSASNVESAKRTYEDFGFGRKVINRLVADTVAFADLKALKRMNDAGLLFRKILAVPDELILLDALLKERKLLA